VKINEKTNRAYANVSFRPDEAEAIERAAHGMSATEFIRWAAKHMAVQINKVDAEFMRRKLGD
jgi:hypothetical protein